MDFDSDADSACDLTSLTTSTSNISESLLTHVEIKGRKYYKRRDDPYWAPNDSKQHECLDLAHYWLKLYFDGKLFHSPVKNIRRFLDIGTGSGQWAIEVADEFPECEVIGTDVAPVQPLWVPPNCRFVIQDATIDWTLAPNSFDLVHVRYLLAAIQDWASFYRNAFRVTRAGGYFEHIEFDIEAKSDTVADNSNHIFKRWKQLYFRAGELIGRDFNHPVHDGAMPLLLQKAGYVDIQYKSYRVPIGRTSRRNDPKRLGYFVSQFIEDSLEGWSLYIFGEVLGMPEEEIKAFLDELRQELNVKANQPYSQFYVVSGRKPLEDEEIAPVDPNATFPTPRPIDLSKRDIAQG